MRKKAAQPSPAQPEQIEKKFSLISGETLLALYANLVKGRMLEERVHRKHNELRGYEAATIGVAMDLASEDTLICAQRNVLPRFLVGERLSSVLRNGAAGPDSRTQLQQALGAAFLHKANKTGKVVAIFRHGGELADWDDVQQLASVHVLPVIFVCQQGLSNGKANSAAHAKKASVARKSRQAGAAGESALPHIAVDGADVVAVYRVAHESIERARRGRGPTLIECVSYKLPGKRICDSVANMKNYLCGKELLPRGFDKKIADEFTAALSAARKIAPFG